MLDGAPSHPDVPAAAGGVQRTPFMGSQAETQGTRGDTGDEASLATSPHEAGLRKAGLCDTQPQDDRPMRS